MSSAARAESVDSDVVGQFAVWPPNPPIGQLRLEDLPVTRQNVDIDTAVLYDFIASRYGLVKNDIFATYDGFSPNVELSLLRSLIFSLEGWTGKKIEQEVPNNAASFTSNKSEFVSEEVNDLISTIKHKTRQWHALLMPSEHKKSGQQYSDKENVEAIEAVFTAHLKTQHPEDRSLFPRTRIFNYGNSKLPSPHGVGFGNTSNVLQILRMRIVDRMSTEAIADAIGEDIAREYSASRNAVDPRLHIRAVMSRVVSEQGRTLLREMNVLKGFTPRENSAGRRPTWPESTRVEIAEQLLAPGATYDEIGTKFGMTEKQLAPLVWRWGAKVLDEVRNDTDPEWEPWIDTLTPISAFFAFYTEEGFPKAIAKAEEIRMGRHRRTSQNKNKEGEG